VALFDYWSAHPPVHLLVASFLGYEAPRKIEDASVRDIMRQVTPHGKSKSLDRAPLWMQEAAAKHKDIKKDG
jgi:hypothetical protein